MHSLYIIVLFVAFSHVLFCSAVTDDKGVCVTIKPVLNMVRETFSIPVTVTFRERCQWYRTCIRQRLENKIQIRVVPKRISQEIRQCCTGYMKLDTIDIQLLCEPICIPACKNGKCIEPGKCSCNDGYTMTEELTHACSPVCASGCRHGSCIAPNSCECNFGYSQINQTCQPICTEPCVNGICIGPENCECLPGYRKTENNICEPYCSNGCLHGTCTAPESCTCDIGYNRQESSLNPLSSCHPVCSEPCHNGFCKAPDVCECNPGYNTISSNTCEPVCVEPCVNGKCVSPNNCVCNEGYSSTNVSSLIPTMTCQPICADSCFNSHCVAPNTCQCVPGYQKLNDSVCIPQCPTGCINGTCVAPGICLCNSGWVWNVTTEECIPHCDETCENQSSTIDKTLIEYDTNDYSNFNSSESVSNTSELMDVNEVPRSNTYNGIANDTSQSLYQKVNDWVSENTNYVIIFYVALSLMILSIIIFVKRETLRNYFKGWSYTVHENGDHSKSVRMSQLIQNIDKEDM